jgi:hypothetical protein
VTTKGKEKMRSDRWHHLSVQEVAQHLDSNLENYENTSSPIPKARTAVFYAERLLRRRIECRCSLFSS